MITCASPVECVRETLTMREQNASRHLMDTMTAAHATPFTARLIEQNTMRVAMNAHAGK